MELSRVVQIMGAAIAEDKDRTGIPVRLCHAFAEALEGRGAVLALSADLAQHRILAASDSRTAELGKLEFTLGEGPGLDAVARCRPVLVGDLAGREGDRWPVLAASIADRKLFVRAVFAFPLQVSGVSFGVLELYRDRPGSLDETDAATARIAADLAAVALVRSFASPGVPAWMEDPHLDGVEIDQAVGMVMAQLRAPAEVALSTLRARAFSEGRALGELAQDVVRRRVVFGPPELEQG